MYKIIVFLNFKYLHFCAFIEPILVTFSVYSFPNIYCIVSGKMFRDYENENEDEN